jgi:hypothetical protein
MQENMNAIASSVRMAAANLIRRQDNVPKSPLRRLEDGRIEFCAAAALVVAATSSQNQRDELIAHFDKLGREGVIEAFANLGWSKELGTRLLQTNDAFDEENRKLGVLGVLDID